MCGLWETQSTSTNSLFWRDHSFFFTPNQKKIFSQGLSTPARGSVDRFQQTMLTFSYIRPFWKEVGQLVSVILDLRFDLIYNLKYKCIYVSFIFLTFLTLFFHLPVLVQFSSYPYFYQCKNARPHLFRVHIKTIKIKVKNCVSNYQCDG